jgi:hypothetical protein
MINENTSKKPVNQIEPDNWKIGKCIELNIVHATATGRPHLTIFILMFALWCWSQVMSRFIRSLVYCFICQRWEPYIYILAKVIGRLNDQYFVTDKKNVIVNNLI